jgi:hypothetical protein
VPFGAGDFVALDGKMGFADSALGRHPDIEDMGDISKVDADEREAGRYGLSYVFLDGESAVRLMVPAWRWELWIRSIAWAVLRLTFWELYLDEAPLMR